MTGWIGWVTLAAAWAAPLQTETVARVTQPTALATADEAIWVASQPGRVVRVAADGTVATVLDLTDRVTSGGERGLVGMALAPDFPRTPYLFVNYTATVDGALVTRVSRLPWDGARFDPTGERVLLTFGQPWANHNGGPLAFGPDGLLYVSVGDGGAGGDPRGTGQDVTDLLGSILRLDVSRGTAAVPSDNPLARTPGARGEVWAWGVRNPWGMAFDGADLWFADVGQDAVEEINRTRAGGNFGWKVWEGDRCAQPSGCPAVDVRGTAFVTPLITIDHPGAASVTGGRVYRGPPHPELDGAYVYGDFAKGWLAAYDLATGASRSLGDCGCHPSAFGADPRGRLLIADYGGRILRVLPP